MTIRRTSIVIAAASSVGLAAFFATDGDTPVPSTPSPPPAPTAAESPPPAAPTPAPVEPIPPPKPTARVTAPPIPKPTRSPATAAPPKPTAEKRRRRHIERRWEMLAQRFNRTADQLDNEADPAQRHKLIQAIAKYVRYDTLATLDWAATLDNPAELSAALEAINKNALVGIGARIERDASGYPRVRDTTIMSAIERSGKTNPGDLILGVMTPDGDTVSFKNEPMADVARALRGEAGTEVRLLMGRPNKGATDDTVYETVVRRSLIVIEPYY